MRDHLIIMKVINQLFFFILCGTDLYLCIFNRVFMLEHALTEYYVSICFVNLLYSNFLMLDGK